MLHFLYSPALTTYMTTGKTLALTIGTFVGRVTSLLFNRTSRFVIAFLPRSKHLVISWLQSPPSVILESTKRESVTTSTFSPSICHEVMRPDLPCSSDDKDSAYNAADLGLILGLGRSSGEGNGKLLQYSYLEPGGPQFMGLQSRTWLRD